MVLQYSRWFCWNIFLCLHTVWLKKNRLQMFSCSWGDSASSATQHATTHTTTNPCIILHTPTQTNLTNRGCGWKAELGCLLYSECCISDPREDHTMTRWPYMDTSLCRDIDIKTRINCFANPVWKPACSCLCLPSSCTACTQTEVGASHFSGMTDPRKTARIITLVSLCLFPKLWQWLNEKVMSG